MPLYFFDLHAGSLSEWDDEGVDAVDVEEAITLAKGMLVAAIADNDRLQGDRHAVVMIRDKIGNRAATVTGTGAGEAKVFRTAKSNSG